MANEALSAGDRSCAAGVLSTYTAHEACREPVARARGGGGPSLRALTAALAADPEGLHTYAARALANVAAAPEAAVALLQTSGGQVAWAPLNAALGLAARSPAFVRDVASAVASLLQATEAAGGEEALGAAARAGVAGALMGVLRTHATADGCASAARGLALLAQSEDGRQATSKGGACLPALRPCARSRRGEQLRRLGARARRPAGFAGVLTAPCPPPARRCRRRRRAAAGPAGPAAAGGAGLRAGPLLDALPPGRRARRHPARQAGKCDGEAAGPGLAGGNPAAQQRRRLRATDAPLDGGGRR